MKFAIIGAGTIGAAIAHLLCNTPSVSVIHVMDRNGNALEELEQKVKSQKLRIFRVGIERELSLVGLLKGFDCIISALPSKHNIKVVDLALQLGIPYVDLGGDDKVFDQELAFNDAAVAKGLWVIPNAGLGPGLTNILAMHGFESFDSVSSIKIYVTSLPENPVPPLNYQLSFSAQGLINDYLNDALMIKDGKVVPVKALDGYEAFSVYLKTFKQPLEAFYVSGATAALAHQLEGKVDTLEFRTIRYKGHRDIMKSLFDLGFDSPRIVDVRVNMTYTDMLVRQLKRNLPTGGPDFVIVQVDIIGKRDGASLTRRYEIYEEYDAALGISAMMKCTALPAVTTALMVAENQLDGKGGVLPPEQILPKDRFIDRLRESGLEIKINEF